MLDKKTKNRLGLLSLVVSVALVALKFYAYFMTRSQVVLTDALESIINVFTSGFAFYSIYLASLPKDENHPYGHGKIEHLSVGFEGGLILFAGLYIFYSATRTLFEPHAVAAPDLGVWLLAAAGIINLGIGYVLVREGKRLKSAALVGDGQHLYIDALTSLVSCAALLLVFFTGIVLFDTLAALLLGVVIVVNGYKMVRSSASALMDESDAATVAEVVAELQRHRQPAWIDVHNLRVQRYGANLHIDCHMQMPYYFSLEAIHNELNKIETLMRQHADAEVEMFVHADPCTFRACSLCHMPDCPVRQHAFAHEVEWNLANAVRNERHQLAEG
ncbi:cation diffusion facilitator family transporter [Hymenobacter aerilatus]|uniref:Cation diffusion facilitator family transporter n=1 Tax=Hymenobacter aerilatus TaxID=2932251 RepID=A0A8T9ST00_9BACT|nr:cation diffusion facilitator family transporter [Hymenobacter aerilatus]UOR05268.1 cation diffusion facilitator family transporter [Hymenobacter aerilatus]